MSTDSNNDQTGRTEDRQQVTSRRLTWFSSLSLIAVGLIAIGVYAVVGLQSQSDVSTDETAAEGRSLPQAQFELAQGEDQGLVHAYCTACHSLAPIVTHSGFTEDEWESEVTKMREQYGAPIDDATAERIITYLQTHYATDTEPPFGTSEHLYNDPVDDR